MNRFLHYAVLAAGLAAVCWAGAGYLGSSALALTITLLVAAFYLIGALELQRFRRATSTLAHAVAQLRDPPAELGRWLEQLHPSLQPAVRLRIEGERVGLPGPALTPYLAGLLVLLGMLGTFLGMVVTLKGTGIALESATDLQAIRASLSAPVKGLGLAFGTSVAGVAASAMLGLASALCRRERLQAGRMLDERIATTLRGFSLLHRREETFKLLQRQERAMPELVDRLQLMMATMERQSQMLNEHLVASQDGFHRKTEAAYAELAASVGQALNGSLVEGARIAGATIQPVVEATMAGIARETASLHETVTRTVQQQLDDLSSRVEASHAGTAQTWKAAFAEHQRASEALSAALLRDLGHAHAALEADRAKSDAQRLSAWTQSLDERAASIQQAWQQAGEHSLGAQQQLCEMLAQTARDMSAQAGAHAQHTVAEVARVLQAASEAPRAAAEVLGELRQKLSDSMARDNTLLEERARILGTLETLLDAVNHASGEQRTAIDALVASSAQVLERVGGRFADTVDTQTERMSAVAAQIAGGAVEVASLGEAFGLAVQLFSESNDKLAAQLQRIEGALGQSMARSDEQLAYYVAQAREVIDLSMLSQKQIIDDLQRLAGRPAPADAEA